MEELMSSEELESIKISMPALLVYFYNDSCAPCVALRPKVEEMMLDAFPLMKHLYVNSAANPELSAANGVFASPTIVVYFEGNENFRVSKYISIGELEARIERYYNLLFS